VEHIEVERLIPHPIERVFSRYTDHVAWSTWAGLGPVRRVRDGSPDPNGVGSVRAFASAPGLREEVIVFEPPRRQEYRVTQGAFPLADHHGEVTFTPEGAGTLVTWRVSFRSKVPGLGWPVARGIAALFRFMLRRLARDLDGGR
jgi:uncharacterized protein YndB with AHSA1/START domain